MFNRTLPALYIFYAAVCGGVFGWLLQVLLSAKNLGIFSPVWIQGAVLVVIGIVVLLLAWQLRNEIEKRRIVRDPVKAVRILAAARAGQLLGGAFTGFGSGLFLGVLPRLAHTDWRLWLPMLLIIGCALLLIIMCAVAERFCRVPPDDSEGESAEHNAGGSVSRLGTVALGQD